MQVRGGWACRTPHVPRPLLACPVSRLGNKASLSRPNAVTQCFFLSHPVYFSAGSGPRILPVKSPFRDQKLSCCSPHCLCPCSSAQG